MSCSHPFLLEADEAFVVIALQLLRRLADQSAELGGHLPRLQHADEALQGGRTAVWGWSLLLLQVVALFLSKVNENLQRQRCVAAKVNLEALDLLAVTHVVQSGLTDRVVLYGQHLRYLLHLTEDLGQGDPLRLQLVLDLGVVTLLQTPQICVKC